MSAVSATSRQRVSWIRTVASRAEVETPALVDWAAAVGTALLLILSFPDFDLAPLAWVGLIPLLVVIARHPNPVRALILGWTTGTIFFYGSCYWLTYSMIHYGGLPAVVAYLLLIPGALLVGLFPGLFALVLALAIRSWGLKALLLAPLIWVATEYARLGVTGQLWNAMGYSQAYYPSLIETARLGGVYAVSFLIVTVNSTIGFALTKRTPGGLLIALVILMLCGAIIVNEHFNHVIDSGSDSHRHLTIIALQPNVPMQLVKTTEEMEQLFERHLTMTTQALNSEPAPDSAASSISASARLVIWPESPMNFTYISDEKFKQTVSQFAIDNRTALLFNTQEPAPAGGTYNSAVLINEKGRMISQYDKIRLLPFGEYVPLPRWLPGASLITAIVGDFTPGSNYTLMPVGDNRKAGVFICIESAYPSIARTMTKGGADALINISNDGYLGPTAVMRQHLANAVFRAVENDRTVVRVTNSGITALILGDGRILDQTKGFEPDVRVWRLSESFNADTFYTKHGDLFAMFCLAVTTVTAIFAFMVRRKESTNLR